MVKDVCKNFVFKGFDRVFGVIFTKVNERSQFSEFGFKVLTGEKFVHLDFKLVKKIFVFIRNFIGLYFFVEELTDVGFLFDYFLFLLSQFFRVLVASVRVFSKLIMRVKFVLDHDFLGKLDRFDYICFFSKTF